jgi:Tol biopolymer transport system component
MFVTSWGGTYFLEGDSSNRAFTDVYFSEGGISPHGDKMVYDVWHCCLTGTGSWPNMAIEVWTSNLDGSGAFNVSGAAGLGGVNCFPQWSPDGSMVAFMHSEGGAGGVLPCEVGFHTWIVNSDGTAAHRVTPEGSSPDWLACWAPNGARLLVDMEGTGAVAIDTDGTDLEVLPGGIAGVWSPDGAEMAVAWTEPGTAGGQPGVWRQLRVADADGSNPVTLLEHFISDADALAHAERIGLEPPSDWVGDVQYWAGPTGVAWSPSGEQIAFFATWPFDPEGPSYRAQSELWLYDLESQEMSRITYDWWRDYALSWGGPNTSPEDPSVTVDNTTVSFSDVADDGLTTIIRMRSILRRHTPARSPSA